MAGKVKSQFRRGASFRLGPLEMDRPIFMEMSLTGLVTGCPGPIVGIIGHVTAQASRAYIMIIMKLIITAVIQYV